MPNTPKRLPYILGKRARSKFEGTVYEQLKKLKRPKQTIEYEVDKLEYVLTKSYIPDFKLTKKDGSVMYIEAKGLGRAFDSLARTKMIAVKKYHPDLDIRFVFMSDRPIVKGGKMTPTMWACLLYTSPSPRD